MKLLALPQIDNRTTLKIYSLVLIQFFIPIVVYRFVFQTEIQPGAQVYLFALMGLAIAVFRVNTAPYWLNTLVMMITSFAAACIWAASDIYL